MRYREFEPPAFAPGHAGMLQMIGVRWKNGCRRPALGARLAGSLLGFKRLVVGAIIGTSITMAIFGNWETITVMQVMAFVVGICIFGGIVGLYSLLGRGFPARMRVTGTVRSIGLGRGGAVLGPIVGGLLLEAALRRDLVLSVVGLCGAWRRCSSP